MFTLSILSVFLIALVMMELLCVAVVLYHCLKTVRMNPDMVSEWYGQELFQWKALVIRQLRLANCNRFRI